MIDSPISRVRLCDLTRLGRFRTGSMAASGHSAGPCASRGAPATVTFLSSSSGGGHAARPRAASSHPAGGDLVESII
jgi:hypothetical protein